MIAPVPPYRDSAAQRCYQNAWLKRKRRSERGGEVREARRAHRARQAGLYGPNPPGPGWEAKRLAEQGGRCHWCPAEIDPGEADHVVALAEGGRHTVENLVLACRPCNGRRGAQVSQAAADK